MDKFNACIAVAHLGLFFLHLSNLRTALRLGVNPTSPLVWTGVSALMAVGFGMAALP